jgi:hypothetical protein
MQKKILLASALAACACVAQGASPNPSQKSLKPAVEKYLKEKGDFCLGKFNWPVIVTELDRQGRTNDAIQMPVLENIGLVASSSAPNDPTAKSYELTDEGKKYYIVKKAVTGRSTSRSITPEIFVSPSSSWITSLGGSRWKSSMAARRRP